MNIISASVFLLASHQIKKVAGRNLLRAMRGTERIAAEIQWAAAGK